MSSTILRFQKYFRILFSLLFNAPLKLEHIFAKKFYSDAVLHIIYYPKTPKKDTVMSRLKRFLYNASLLTLTSLAMRAVSLGFGIWLSNRVGPEAIGLFTLISGVYGFALTLATSGISLAVTRMVAEALGHEDHGRVRAAMRRCLSYALFFGSLSMVLLLTLAEPIGLHWLGDARTVIPLRLMSSTLPLIALCSALNGYFTAVRRVVKNAASQMLEQALKIGVTVFLIISVLPGGIENACIALVLGGVVSELFSFFVMVSMFLIDKKRHISKSGKEANENEITRNLLGIALPVALSAYVRSALLSVEHALIPIGLKKSGSSHERALAAYGTLSGMALPIVTFPMALISSFAGMTVPELSDCLARGHQNRVRYIAGRVWQFSLLFSIGVSGILICFSGELGAVLYSSSEAGGYISLLAPLIPIMYLDHTTDALLKGLGQQLYSMTVNIVDAAASTLLVWLLVPHYGIAGYIFVIIAMEIVNFGLSAVRMLNLSGMKPRLVCWVLKPTLCIIGSTSITRLVFSLLPLSFPTPLTLTIHIAASALIYLFLLRLIRAFDAEDREWLKSIINRSA